MIHIAGWNIARSQFIQQLGLEPTAIANFHHEPEIVQRKLIEKHEEIFEAVRLESIRKLKQHWPQMLAQY